MVSYLKFEEERYTGYIDIFSAIGIVFCLLYAVKVVRNYRRLVFFRGKVGNINSCSDFRLALPE